jgi:hypothetical protein
MIVYRLCVPCIVEVYYFLCIHFKFLCIRHDVLAYENVWNIIYHFFGISMYGRIYI